MSVPLATAFIRLKPLPDRAAFVKAGREMGALAGTAAGKRFNTALDKESGKGTKVRGEKVVKDFASAMNARLRTLKLAEIDIKANPAEALAAMKATELRLKELSGNAATLHIKVESDRALKDMGRLIKQVDTEAEAGGQSAARRFSSGFKKGSSDSSAFSKALSIMSARTTLIGAAAAAALPSVLHLTAALAPAAGAVNVLPAALLSSVAALSTYKVAVFQVSDAVGKGLYGTTKQYEKALADLPPAQKAVTKSLVALKPQIQSLREAVGERFFKPLVADLKPLVQTFLPLFRTQMGNVASGLGGLAHEFAQVIRTSEGVGIIKDTFDSTSKSLVILRQAVSPVVFALASLIKATAPFLPRMVQDFTNLALRASDFVFTASETGRVAAGFEAARKVIGDLFGIVRNLGSILGSVLKAASVGTESLLGTFRTLTGQLAAFLHTADGMGALNSVFSTLNKLGQALGTGLGAVLPAIGRSLVIIGPVLANLSGPVADLIVALAPLLPYAVSLAGVLLRALTPAIAQLANFLSRNEGIMKAALITFLAYNAAHRALALVAKVDAAGGLAAFAKSIFQVSAIQKVATATSTGLGVAFRFMLGPIGLIITAVALLVAGLIYLFNHNKAFHDQVIAVWTQIKTVVVGVVNWFTGTALPALQRVWGLISAAVVVMWSTYVRPALTALQGYISQNVIPTVLSLWRNVIQPAFQTIGVIISVTWNSIIKPALSLWWAYMKNFVIPVVLFLWRNVIQPAFIGIGIVIGVVVKLVMFTLTTWMALLRNVVFPAIRFLLTVVQVVFKAMGATISAVIGAVRATFSGLATFITKNVPDAFRSSVTAITKAWDAVKSAARTPVKFVVDHVINPFIGGFNKISGVFKGPQIPAIAFAAGGQVPRSVPGYASGGRISGLPSSRDNRLAPATIPGVGAVKLAGGEFVVNASDTRRAFPILKWINDGMRGGARAVAKLIGRPLADMPGDGSEGWAFKDGGLVGWVKSITGKGVNALNSLWDSVSDPGKLIKAPFEAALRAIPGGGAIKDFLVSAGNSVLSGALNWIKGNGGGAGGDVGKVSAFVRAQAGKPYVWASAGPGGYDCSGIVSAAFNLLHGRSPYSHTFSTEGLPGGFFNEGGRGALMAGWSHPGQSPASSSTGHMAGQIGALPFESRGSRGVIVGPAARRITEFAHTGVARANGGLIPGKGIRLFDSGGFWPSGTLGANMSGRTEYVKPAGAGRGGDIHIHLHNDGVIGSQDELDRWLATSVTRLKRQKKLT